MDSCLGIYLLIYASPVVSIIAFVLTLSVAWITNTQRTIVSDIQIKSICLIDDYLQVLVPRGISRRFKRDEVVR
ncbi:unnamed protein product, partial [Mesorhabditis spiculigera]